MVNYKIGISYNSLLCKCAILMFLLFCLLTSAMAIDLNSSLLAHWDFNEGSGAVLHDVSGNGNNGTIYGASWAEGISGHSLQFDGANDYVNLGNVLNGVKFPFTIAAWVKPGWGHTAAEMTYPVFGNDIGDYYYGPFLYFWSSSVSYTLGLNYGNGGWPGPGSRYGKFCRIDIDMSWLSACAVARSARDISLFINGVDMGGSYMGTAGSMAHSSYPAMIGHWASAANSYWFKGCIDELRIYNRALSTEDIQALYQAHYSTRVLNLPANQYGKYSLGHPTYSLSLPAGDWQIGLVSPDTNSQAQYWAWCPGQNGQEWHTMCAIYDDATSHSLGMWNAASNARDAYQQTASSGNAKTVVHLDTASTLHLGVDDSYIDDNQGGLSLLVSAVPVFGINNRAAYDQIVSAISGNYNFKVFGKVEILVSGSSFAVDDGSGMPVTVVAPGFSGIETGDYASVVGYFTGDGSSRVLNARTSNILKLR